MAADGGAAPDGAAEVEVGRTHLPGLEMAEWVIREMVGRHGHVGGAEAANLLMRLRGAIWPARRNAGTVYPTPFDPFAARRAADAGAGDEVGRLTRERDMAVMALAERTHELDEAEEDLAATEARAEAAEGERDAVRASAIEDCIAALKALHQPFVVPGFSDGTFESTVQGRALAALAAQLGGTAREGGQSESFGSEKPVSESPFFGADPTPSRDGGDRGPG